MTIQSEHDLEETRAMTEALAIIFEVSFHEAELKLMAGEIKSIDTLLDFIYSKERIGIHLSMNRKT